MDLDFQETCTIYPVTSDDYGNDIPGTPATVPFMYQQQIGKAHSNHQDSVTSAAPLVLPADDEFVLAHNYRLEGMVIQLNPFGADTEDQYFRIEQVNPARDVLLDNEVRHVEVTVKKITDFSYVS